MNKLLSKYINKTLECLSGKIDDFYLAGGTALSLFYFNHRFSQDLDFFTKAFSVLKIRNTVELLNGELKKRVELLSSQTKKDKVRIQVFLVKIGKSASLKIDFVEDYVKLLKPLKTINGINVLSLEDIYIRKIFAISGTAHILDGTGRKISTGGRQEAKDFYDLYCLSNTFINISDFLFKYGSPVILEAIIRWYRGYDRLKIKSGLLDLETRRKVDYAEIERHFKKQINRIIQKEVNLI